MAASSSSIDKQMRQEKSCKHTYWGTVNMATSLRRKKEENAGTGGKRNN